MARNMFVVTLSVFALSIAGSRPAAASEEPPAVTKTGSISDSRHDLSAQLGYQAGFGANFGSPSGIKLVADYSFRFHRLVWFNAELSNVFGFGGADGRCVNSLDSLCYRGGWDLGIAAGVRLKFKTRVPLLVEVPLLVGVNVLYNRECRDNGAAAPVARPGIRATYFVTDRIGLGAAMNLAFGPAFHAGGDPLCSTQAKTGFYGAADFLLGAEFLL
jgi:hypothetical protein